MLLWLNIHTLEWDVQKAPISVIDESESELAT